jgi:hypothetical protein
MLTRLIAVFAFACAPATGLKETGPKFDGIPFTELVEAILYDPKKLRAIADSQ